LVSLLVSLGELYIYHDLGLIFKNVGGLWRVSDCEELMGLLIGDDGVGLNFTFYDFSFEKGRL